MDPLLLLIGLTVAASAGLLTFLAYQRLGADRRNAGARIAAPGVGLGSNPGPDGSGLRRSRRSLPLSNLLPLSGQAEERMRRELERAGWPIRVGEYLSIRLAAAAAGSTAGLLLLLGVHFGPAGLRVILMFVLALGGWLFPRLLLSRARRKRLEKVEGQIADAVMGMAKSLRAGTGLLQALAYAAKETPAPLGPELHRTLRELQMGAEAEAVLGALSARVGSPDLDIVVTAIIIQRTSGGNLSEILFNVTNTIRERAKIQADIRVLTAQQRISANLMALIPVVIAVLFILLNPDTGKLLINTTVGQIALAVGITFELSGLWLIRRLAVIEV